MASGRRLVLDANILVRAVLGRRARQIIETHSEHAAFFAPDVALADARRHLPDVVRKRGGDDAAVEAALELLEAVARNVLVLGYARHALAEDDDRELQQSLSTYASYLESDELTHYLAALQLHLDGLGRSGTGTIRRG